MSKIKLFFAIIMCKLLIAVGKPLGKGTSLPGEIVLKIFPSALNQLKLPRTVIAVTGSNGKTSTAEMISAVLEANGKTVLNNKEGSNQLAGAATLLLGNAKLSGVVKADILVLEADERYAKFIFRHIKPTHFVVTNLYRDQLTRNAHPFFVLDRLKEAVELIPDTQLILNADDPIVCTLGEGRNNNIYFGMAENARSSSSVDTVYEDCSVCPVCGGKMRYNYYHYAHLGDYECLECHFKRHEPEYEVNEADFDGKRIVINGEEIKLAFESRYNVYNICAAVAACGQYGIAESYSAKTLSGFVQQRGRQVILLAGKNKGTLLISKHENSVAYNTNLEYITHKKDDCTLAIVVDSISRKYYTAETGWLWDISFEKLTGSNVKRILLCGRYAFDLATRFSVFELPGVQLEVLENLDDMANKLKESGNDGFYLMTCFSDKDKIFSRLQAQSPVAK